MPVLGQFAKSPRACGRLVFRECLEPGGECGWVHGSHDREVVEVADRYLAERVGPSARDLAGRDFRWVDHPEARSPDHLSVFPGVALDGGREERCLDAVDLHRDIARGPPVGGPIRGPVRDLEESLPAGVVPRDLPKFGGAVLRDAKVDVGRYAMLVRSREHAAAADEDQPSGHLVFDVSPKRCNRATDVIVQDEGWPRESPGDRRVSLDACCCPCGSPATRVLPAHWFSRRWDLLDGSLRMRSFGPGRVDVRRSSTHGAACLPCRVRRRRSRLRRGSPVRGGGRSRLGSSP